MNTTFFSEMLQSIADRGRALIQRREPARERFDVRHMIDRYFAVYEKIAGLHSGRPGQAA